MHNPEKKFTVSIGIPAYNEEANIGHLIKKLLEQEEENFQLLEIIVVSDQSTDNTDQIVTSFDDRCVKLIRNEKRVGGSQAQNIITKNFTGELLLLVDADTLPINNQFLSKIVKPFYKNSRLGLVSPRMEPLPGRTLFEKILYDSFKLRADIFEDWNNGSNMYLCYGSCRLFLGEFVRKIQWPKVAGEDVYSYLLCLQNGYTFKHIVTTAVFFRLPDNFKDHLRQSARYVSSEQGISKYFPVDMVRKNYAVPRHIILKHLAIFLILRPLSAIGYLFIFAATRLYPDKKRFNTSMWEISESSKTLIHTKQS
ncbi:MAG: glycosyltransferase [Candidatus Roizmanbacteria bacterium]|nr:glycosyltransferase [Candidatus Roizmanbacteria bacterium]